MYGDTQYINKKEKKKMKRLLALIMAMAFIFCFAGCEEAAPGVAGSGGEGRELTAAEIIENSLKATKDATSVRSEIDANMEIEMFGQAMDMTMSGIVELDTDAGKSHIKMDIESDMMGSSAPMDVEMYSEKVGNTETVYVNNQGSWEKTSASVADYTSLGIGFDGLDGISTYLEYFIDCEAVKEGESYRITGNFETDILEMLLSGMMTAFDSEDDLPRDAILGLTESMEEIDIVMYVDADTFYVTEIQMDMGDFMIKMFEAITGELGFAMSPDKAEYTATIKYYDYNENLNIEIPDEAKAA